MYVPPPPFLLKRTKEIHLHIGEPLGGVAVNALGNDGLYVLAAAAHVEELAGPQGVVEAVLVGAEVVVHLARHQGSHLSNLQHGLVSNTSFDSQES